MNARNFARHVWGGMLVIMAGILSSCNYSNTVPTSSYGNVEPPFIVPSHVPPPTSTLKVQLDLPYQPVWRCGTPTPMPTTCSTNDEGTVTACNTPQATATTYMLLNDFPLGKHVQVGPIGQSDLGLWVWIDRVDIYQLPGDGNGGPAWAAVWEITAENSSKDIYFEFNPAAQAYIYEVQMQDGSSRKGHFLPDFDVMRYLAENNGLDFPIVPEVEALNSSFGSNSISPSSKETVRLAAAIPGPEVLRLAYTFLPNSASSINEDSGGNEAIWYTRQDDGDCPSEVTPGPEGIPAQAVAGSFKLARWPVTGTIVRGFGCTGEFTGMLGSDCPSGQPWFHDGIDIGVPSGVAVVDALPDNGAITYAGPDTSGSDCSDFPGALDPKTGYGIYISQNGVIDGTTITLIYAHLSGLSVNSADTTAPGQVIGLSGSTGCSTGPHLHFAVAAGGQYIDPLTVLP